MEFPIDKTCCCDWISEFDFFCLSNSFGITQNIFCNKKQYESISQVTQNKNRGKRPCDTLSKTMKLPCRCSTVFDDLVIVIKVTFYYRP